MDGVSVTVTKELAGRVPVLEIAVRGPAAFEPEAVGLVGDFGFRGFVMSGMRMGVHGVSPGLWVGNAGQFRGWLWDGLRGLWLALRVYWVTRRGRCGDDPCSPSPAGAAARDRWWELLPPRGGKRG